MSRQPTGRPTDSELAILRVLWQLGPSPVRAVYDELSRTKPTGYTTVLKIMQIMFAKGLVTRNSTATRIILRNHCFQQQVLLRRDWRGFSRTAPFGVGGGFWILGLLSTREKYPPPNSRKSVSCSTSWKEIRHDIVHFDRESRSAVRLAIACGKARFLHCSSRRRWRCCETAPPKADTSRDASRSR